MKNNQKGFAPVLLILIAVAVIVGGVYLYTQNSQKEESKLGIIIENSVSTTEKTQSTQKTNEDWKTYRDEKYGFEFQYPSTWFVQVKNDGELLSFTKTSSGPSFNSFASFNIIKLNDNKEHSEPSYTTPQEFFNYYYLNNLLPSVVNHPPLQFIQLGQVPAIRRLGVYGETYVAYTPDRELSFHLRKGDVQNPSEYVPSDSVIMEQVIKTFNFTDSSKQFVKISLPIETKEKVLNETYDLGGEEKYNFIDGKFYYKYAEGKGDPVLVENYPSNEYSVTIDKEHVVTGDFSRDGIEDAAIIMGKRFGGSGYFTTLVVLKNNTTSFVPIGKVDLGDRQTILSLKIENSLIKIEYLTQGEGEALCCGTKRVYRTFKIEDGKVVEV